MRCATCDTAFDELSKSYEDRISRLEEQVHLLLMHQSATYPICPPSPVSSVADSQMAELRLSCPTLPVSKWFTKRPMPEFEVRVVDKDGNLFSDTNSWTLSVRLMCGSNQFVDHFLSTPTSGFVITSGRAIISGLRFNAVSSRNGGYFRLHFAIPSCVANVNPIFSSDFRVLSERLKSEGKVSSLLELSPADPLSRAPGIGKKYAARMAEHDIATVQDLAEMDDKKRKGLLESIRKDRGALTESRLTELCMEAREVVRSATSTPTARPVLKRKFEPVEMAVAVEGECSAEHPATTTPFDQANMMINLSDLSDCDMEIR